MIAYRSIEVENVRVFYREAGDPQNPTIVLLHGFPSSSHMFQNLFPLLEDRFHLLAPDYPGFGNSDLPAPGEQSHTFDHIARTIEQWLDALGQTSVVLYMQDFGLPVGFRIAQQHPDWIRGLIIQNGGLYEQALTPFWDASRALWQARTEETEAPLRGALGLQTFQWLFTHGTRNPEAVNPDNWNLAAYQLSKPDVAELYFDLFYDYQSNVVAYPAWQQYLRQHQPRTLVVWGRHDQLFSEAGANLVREEVASAEIYLFDTGHFALEEESTTIAEHIHRVFSA